jgi:phosphatidylinositol 4-kinase
LFYKGFSAVLKHKDSIITLVKMMFSCHGESMGCFKKGELAIE